MAEENTNENVDNVPGADAPQIGLVELSTMRQILDIATARGAFRGGELKAVGEVYDKLDAFLKYVEDAQKKAAERLEEEQKTNTDESASSEEK